MKGSENSLSPQTAKIKPHASPLATAPAYLILICLCSFLSLRTGFGLPCIHSITVSILIPTGWALIGTAKPNRSSAGAALSVFIVAACCIAITSSKTSPAPSTRQKGEIIEAAASIISSRQWGFGFVALASSADTGEIFLLEMDDKPPQPGDAIVFSGRFRPFERSADARKFDEYMYWKARGAVGAAENATVAHVGTHPGFALWRRLLAERITKKLPPLTAGYMLALVTGEKDGVLESLHRAVGTSHLLAVSGFHVGIVWGVCWFLFKGFRSRLILISVFLWLYVLLVGAAPSAMRAAFMIQLAILGRILGRGSGNPFNTVSAAGVLLLLFNPWLFWDIGWRLSMLAALSITSVSSLDSISYASKTICAGLLVWLATSLQGTWTFGEVPAAGLFLNFIALPVFAFLYPLAMAASIPALAGVPGGYFAAALPELLFGRWEVVSSNIAYLLPLKVHFSTGLLLFGTAAIAYSHASACGFGRKRSLIASAMALISGAMLLS